MLQKELKSFNLLGLLNGIDEIKPLLFRDSQVKAVRKLDCKKHTIRNKKIMELGSLLRSCNIHPQLSSNTWVSALFPCSSGCRARESNAVPVAGKDMWIIGLLLPEWICNAPLASRIMIWSLLHPATDFKAYWKVFFDFLLLPMWFQTHSQFQKLLVEEKTDKQNKRHTPMSLVSSENGDKNLYLWIICLEFIYQNVLDFSSVTAIQNFWVQLPHELPWYTTPHNYAP